MSPCVHVLSTQFQKVPARFAFYGKRIWRPGGGAALGVTFGRPVCVCDIDEDPNRPTMWHWTQVSLALSLVFWKVSVDIRYAIERGKQFNLR